MLFETGDPLRFGFSLRGTGTAPLHVAGSGSVQAVVSEGTLFVVEATIDSTTISVSPAG